MTTAQHAGEVRHDHVNETKDRLHAETDRDGAGCGDNQHSHPIRPNHRAIPSMYSTRIIIEAVPPDEMRLPAYRQEGFGDWYVEPGTGDIRIKIAAADVWDQEEAFLVALHELIEARLCSKSGVVQGAVDNFDAAFTGEGEPGDDPAAPYRVQHRQACMVEHMMALFLGITDYGRVE
jgi:hypothetical protein